MKRFLPLFFLAFSVHTAFSQCLNFNTTATPVSCFNSNDGQVTINVTSGVGPFTYELYLFRPGFGQTPMGSVNTASTTVVFQKGNGTLSALFEPTGIRANSALNPPGNEYRVFVSASGSSGDPFCETLGANSIIVTQPPQLTITLNNFDPDCDPAGGTGNGKIDLTVSGGTAPYTITWTGPTAISSGTQVTPPNLDAGAYTVDVTDANSCIKSLNISLPVATQADAGAATGLTCGVNSFALSGNTPGPGETGSWTGPPGVTFSPNANTPNATANNLGAGQNTLRWTIVDSGGICSGTFDEIEVTFSPAINLSTTLTNILCKGSSTGAIDLHVTGGISPYTYAWSNGSVLQDLSNIPAGTYSITVTDAATCTATLNNIAITEPAAAVSGTITKVDVTCFGASTGSITLTGSGGVSPYNFSIDNGASYSVASAASNVFSGLAAGNYNLKVKDVNGCESATIPVAIAQPAAVTANIAVNGTATICLGSSASLKIDFTGTGPWTFKYSDGIITSPAIPSFFNSITFPVSPSTTTTYTVVFVEDANGCAGTGSGSAVVTVNPAPDANRIVDKTIDPLCINGSGGITVDSENGVSYQLRNDANDALIGTAVVGTGGPITLNTGALTATTTFNILASVSGCTPVELATRPTVNVLGNIDVSLSATALNDPLCQGDATFVRIANAVIGVDYQLRDDADDSHIGVAVAGTGGDIDLPTGTLNGTTTFNVLASNGTCSAALTDTPTVNIQINPDASLAVNALLSPVCMGGQTQIRIQGSETGVAYQLRDNSNDNNIGGTVVGTGADILLPTGVLNATTTFNILASSGPACAPVELTTTPMVTVTGVIDGSLAVAALVDPVCENTAATIRITNSETGVVYQLRNDLDDSNLGAPLAGTGADLDLSTGNLASITTINVLATNGTCSLELSNLVTVNTAINPAPNLTISVSIDPVCVGGSSGIKIQNSEVGVTYQLRNDFDDSNIGSAVSGTGGMITLPTGGLAATTTFNVLASSGTACSSVEMTTSPVVTVNGMIDASLVTTATQATICANTSTLLQVAASEVGVNYQLRRDSDDSLVGASVAGNGGTISLPTGNLSSTTVFNVLAKNGTCSIELTDTETITVDPAPVAALGVTASSNLLCANTSSMITVVASEAGVSYQLRNNADNSLVGGVVNGTGMDIAFSTGNLMANSTFNILATSGNCAVQLNTLTSITIRAAGDPVCGGGGGGTGTCASVVIVPKPKPATCTNSDGSLVMSIKPFIPAVNNTGVKITISGVSPTNLPISRTIFNDSVFTLLPMGTYDYQIEYGDPSCVKTGKVTIDQSGTVGTPVVTNVTGPVCLGSATGSLTLDVPGETGNVLEWSLDAGLTDPFKPFAAGTQITGIPAGPAPVFQQVISVRRNISDVCYAFVTVIVNETVQDISATFDISPATCNRNDGAVTNIVPSGGHGAPYTFSLDGGLSFQASPAFNSLAGGSYTLRVKDSAGCEKDFTLNVTFPGFINSFIGKNNADCSNNGNSGSVSVTVTDPGAFEVALSTDQFNEPAASEYIAYKNPSLNFNSLPRGEYFAYVKSNGVGCPTRSAPIKIFGVYAINFDLEPDCNNNELSMALVNVTGEPGGAPLEIQISKKLSSDPPEIIYKQFPANGEIYLDRNQYNFLKTPGDYRIRIIQFQNEVVCNLSSKTIDFKVPAPLTARIGLVSESFPDIPTGKLQVTGFSGGSYPYDVRIELDSASSFALPYHVTDFEEAGINQNQQVEMNYNGIPAGRYRVEVKDSLGCVLDLTTRVPLDVDLYIPNVFTPNNDGSNEVFFIRNLPPAPSINQLVISNRWGKEVFVSDNYQNNWDGEGVADGIYYYRLQLADNNALTGWIEIIRGQKP